MSERWFQNQRQQWIGETLQIFGFINREHICKKFGVSIPQASSDLNVYLREHPNAMSYNKTTKRYEAI